MGADASKPSLDLEKLERLSSAGGPSTADFYYKRPTLPPGALPAKGWRAPPDQGEEGAAEEKGEEGDCNTPPRLQEGRGRPANQISPEEARTLSRTSRMVSTEAATGSPRDLNHAWEGGGEQEDGGEATTPQTEEKAGGEGFKTPARRKNKKKQPPKGSQGRPWALACHGGMHGSGDAS